MMFRKGLCEPAQLSQYFKGRYSDRLFIFGARAPKARNRTALSTSMIAISSGFIKPNNTIAIKANTITNP